MFGKRPPPYGHHWMRHTASIPKGFLRFHILRLLASRPMSGSEIMSEIEKETVGRWKPSPGSVYPLLAWLQDNGYIKEQPTEESGIKRYALTDQGKSFLKEETKLGEGIRRRMEFMAPPFLWGFWTVKHQERIRELMEPARRLARAMMDLRAPLEERFSEQTLKEVEAILNDAAEKIEELGRRLKEEATKG
jgi:DNA-binding PadR family transcriptional regulator